MNLLISVHNSLDYNVFLFNCLLLIILYSGRWQSLCIHNCQFPTGSIQYEACDDRSTIPAWWKIS